MGVGVVVAPLCSDEPEPAREQGPMSAREMGSLCLLELSISIHALSLVSRAGMNTFPVFAAA